MAFFSLNGAHQDLEKKPISKINFNYFATIGIDERLYPYAVTPVLFCTSYVNLLEF